MHVFNGIEQWDIIFSMFYVSTDTQIRITLCHLTFLRKCTEETGKSDLFPLKNYFHWAEPWYIVEKNLSYLYCINLYYTMLVRLH